MNAELLPHLETFCEVAERGSFTAAARQLGVTQAAISQRIQQIEVLLRVRLFRRERDGVSITDAGLRLHGYARQILDLAAKACADVTGLPQVVAGELLLGASSVPGHYLLPLALAAFRKRYPDIQVRVAVSDTEAVLVDLKQGRVHLGLVGGYAATPHLEFRVVARDELVLVVPPGHPWWRKITVTTMQLATQPLLQRECGSGSRQCLERALERSGATRNVTAVLELGSTEAIKEAVAAGLGVAVLSRRSVEKEVKARQMKALHIAGLTLERDIFIVRHRHRVLPVPAQLFLNLVGSHLPDPATSLR